MRKLLLSLLFTACTIVLFCQKNKIVSAQHPKEFNPDSVFYSQIKYREIGPFRGGRSGAVAGSFKDKNVFYFGATGGGLWKTSDGGNNWKNISDKYFGGSIGSIAVSASEVLTLP